MTHFVPAFPAQADNAPEHDAERRQWLLASAAAAGGATLVTAWPFVSSLAPSERARAMGASVEVDISDIAPGSIKTVEWRGKPVWVMRRTPDILATLPTVDDRLADPTSAKDQQPAYAKNATRSIKPEVLVVTAICTHLGCSPTSVPAGTNNPSVGNSWPGGFFCPCHGSTFDLAGRVFKNKPAPTNLEVPPHKYLSDTQLLIGDDSVA